MFCSMCGSEMLVIPTKDFFSEGHLWFCRKEKRVSRLTGSRFEDRITVYDLSHPENDESHTQVLEQWCKDNRD